MSNPNHQARLGALIVLLGSFALYLLSLAPTVQGFDSAELTMGAYDLGFVHPTGYPLYMLTGHIFSRLPLGEVGLRLNLMSAVFASLGATLLFMLVIKQTRNFWAGLAATALFATTPVYWSQAIRAEVYCLHVSIMLATLLAWYEAQHMKKLKSYALVFVLLGLGLANHMTSVLLWAGVLLSSMWLDPKLRRATLPGSLLGLVIAGIFYLYFPWRATAEPQIDYIRPYFPVDMGTLGGIWWMVSGQAFRCLVSAPSGVSDFVRQTWQLGSELFNGTLGIGVILAIPGWIVLNHSERNWNRLLSIYFIANLGMYLLYGAVDKEVMFIPMYAVVCIWFANGTSSLGRWLAKNNEKFDPVKLNLLISLAVLGIILVGVILDWQNISLRNDRRAYEFAEQVLEKAEPSTTIISHWATASVFDYMLMVEDRRPDVNSFNADFYFLGIQESCQPISNQLLSSNGWIDWLTELSAEKRLCYIEPLHGLPEGYRWRNHGLCWDLTEDIEGP